MNEELTRKAIVYIEELFEGNADGHDAAHTLRVYKNTIDILKNEPEADEEVALLAALLHDTDDHKLFNTENNANARKFLTENGITEEEQERICTAINSVSFSKNKGKKPETLEGQIVQDADRLDALGAIGIARTFAFGGKNGRPLEESIQHFYDKLLLLKDTMNTQSAGIIARKRHEFLLAFLEQYQEENGFDIAEN